MISEIANFLAEFKRDSANMSHISHYSILNALFSHTERMLEVCYLTKTIIEEYETFGSISHDNIKSINRLLNGADR